MTWVITKNSMAHKALFCMRLAPKNLTEIKTLIDYKQSTEKFTGTVMNILTNGGFVRRRDERFYITERGENTLIEYGAPRIVVRGTIHHIPGPSYDGLEILITIQRPGADDHMKYPSRRGEKLYFRDGRVQDV